LNPKRAASGQRVSKSKNNKILLTFKQIACDFNLLIYALYEACHTFTADRDCK